MSEKNILVDATVLERMQAGKSAVFDGARIFLEAVPVAAVSVAVPWKMPELAFSGPVALPGLGALLESRPRPPFSDHIEPTFLRAAADFCAGQAADFSGVVGAGAGLTPSGDDMLVGFALAVLFRRPERLPDLQILCRPLLEKTTMISRHLLDDALRGKFSLPLVSLLLALKQGAGVEDAAETAFLVGGSSGRDGVFGLYQGLVVLQRPGLL